MNGRFVVLASAVPDLTANPNAGVWVYLYVRDPLTGTLQLVTVTPSGAAADGDSGRPAISEDGRWVVFESDAGDLVTDDRNGEKDVFLRDLVPGDTNDVEDVFLHDLNTGTNTLVSVNRDGTAGGNGPSSRPVISGDGRYVVFQSAASDLVPRDTNDRPDVFVRDMAAGRTLLVSTTASGASGTGASLAPVMAPDGRTVALLTWATDLGGNDANRASDILVLRLGSGPAGDSDQDGLPDDWEVTYFNSLIRDGSGDLDTDGLSDRDEYRAGTDPTNEGSALRVLTLSGVGGGNVTVLWAARAGRTYRVQFKDTIEAAWSDLPGDVVASTDTATKLDTTTGANLARFYRAILVE